MQEKRSKLKSVAFITSQVFQIKSLRFYESLKPLQGFWFETSVAGNAEVVVNSCNAACI